MATHPCPHRKKPASPPPPVTAPPPPQEPEMRRWRHPVGADNAAADASAHYIHCALAYQNQLLAEIKSLLEQIALQSMPERGEK